MESYIVGNVIKTAKNMVLEDKKIKQLDIYMKDNGQMENIMDMGGVYTRTGCIILDNGKII